MNHNGGTKIEAPPELMNAISKIQVEKGIDQWDASIELVSHVNQANEKFERAVKAETERRAKSQFLSQLNLTRNKIARDNYSRGVNDTRTRESNLSLPCEDPDCHEPRFFSSRYDNWPQVYQVLLRALGGWKHAWHAPKKPTPAPAYAASPRIQERCSFCGNDLIFWVDAGQIYKLCQNPRCPRCRQALYHGPAT